MNPISRRKLMTRGLAGAAGVSGIAVAAKLAGEHGLLPPDAGGIYGCGHALTYATLRLLTRDSNAREFQRSQISTTPHARGSAPKGDEFARLQAGGFADWRLKVDGMVERPGSFSLADIKNYPMHSQITQLICEEGWSYIAEWSGVQLAQLLDVSGVLPQAKYVVFRTMDGRLNSLDMDEARHGQTLVAYGFNSGDLPVGHGGPLRLRVPKQLGYKNLKYLQSVTVTDKLSGGRRSKYSWYAGI